MGNYLVVCNSWIWSLRYGKNWWKGFKNFCSLFLKVLLSFQPLPFIWVFFLQGVFQMVDGALACGWRGKRLMVFETVQASPWSGRQWKEVSRFMAAWFDHGSSFHCGGWPKVDRESERERERERVKSINHNRKVAWDVHTQTASPTRADDSCFRARTGWMIP